jgi:hypothetical protein
MSYWSMKPSGAPCTTVTRMNRTVGSKRSVIHTTKYSPRNCVHWANGLVRGIYTMWFIYIAIANTNRWPPGFAIFSNASAHSRKSRLSRSTSCTPDVSLFGTWQGMLAHQLPHLPPFDSFWSELPNIFSWLDTGAPKPALTQAPTQPSEEILRPHVGGYADLVGNAGLMERIRFAAQSGLLVALDYIRLDGQVRRPTIEPYSLRRSQSGEISLAGFDVDAGHIKMYRVDRIQSARVLDRTFSPRYAIELGPLARVLPIATRPATTMTSRVATGSSRRSSFARPSRTRAAGVPTYVVECMYCRKKFRRRSYDTALNAHKMPSGWDCPGRAGAVVDTKW